MAQSKTEAIRDLVMANRILSEEKVLFEAFGHISVRNPENPNEFLLSRSLAASQVEEGDIYTYDMDATCLTPTEKRSFAERIIYSSIYKQRPDVLAICHNHAQELIPFTVVDVPFRPVSHYGAPFYQGVPVYDDYDVSDGMLIKNEFEGDRVARALGDKTALFLRGHGVIVVGETLQKCVMNSVFMRIDGQNQYNSLLLGKPKYLSYEEGKTCNERTWNEVLSQERAWNYWTSKVNKQRL